MSRPRVLLVNAPPFEVVEPWYDLPAFGRQGLACLAGSLRASDVADVAILDAKFERIGFDEACRRAIAYRPDIVGFTAFTNEIKPAAHLAGLIRRALPQATLLIGGVHVTALPEPTLREFPVFDIGCLGEGEQTIVELCEALANGGSLLGVPGLVFRREAALVRSPERPTEDDLDSFAMPAWDLLPRADEYWVMTQRGCPFTCRFCMNPNGRRPRQHSIERVVAELDGVLSRFAPRKLWFADEIFSLDVPRTRKMLDAMIQARVGERTKWWAESHVNFVDESLFAQMKRAGCEECALGIETGDEAALKGLGKGTNVAMITEAFDAAKRAGLRSIGFFILGHPNETPESIAQTIRLAVRVNPGMPIFGVMVPYPGTEVARLAALGQGGYRLLTDDWGAFNKQIGGALEFAGLTRRQIEIMQLRGYVEVFLRNGRYGDFAKFAWNYRTAGLGVLRKVIKGNAKEEAITPTVDRLAELATASEGWAKRQVRNVRQLRSVSTGSRVDRARG